MLTPREIVEALDKYIIGQGEAKRAVAVALRNRYRRMKLSPEMREEITPKNIILMGPTGVGKTEIARRLAKLADAPFVKVEATKFTEVGYVGRDVDSMIRDLVETSIRLCKRSREEGVRLAAESAAQLRLVELLMPEQKKHKPPQNPFQILLNAGNKEGEEQGAADTQHETQEHRSRRETLMRELTQGLHDDDTVEVEVEQSTPQSDALFAIGVDINMNDLFGGILPKQKKLRRMSVKEARRILTQEEADKLIDMDDVIREAVEKAEQDGIIFIDEIDKIIGNGAAASGPDVSREGVQRDILPIVEGSTVSTKYGPVKTDHILFIAAGAFHVSKINDMIPELRGRFPINVELKALTADDFKKILTQPEHSIIEQYCALLETDNIALKFTDDALTAIAGYAYSVNETSENIGARRLHTVMEILLDDISFNAGGDHPLIEVVIDKKYVDEHLKDTSGVNDLQRFII